MSKDWTGDKKSVYTIIGANNHTNTIREENDYYATDPKAVKMLLDKEHFNKYILEPACGQGHISNVLVSYGYNVRSSDIIDRGYSNSEIIDFFKITSLSANTDIITNPPYKYATEFVKHSIDIINDGCKVAMLLKLTFLEGKNRYELFKNYPPKKIYVFSSRITCAKNGDFYRRDIDGNIMYDTQNNPLLAGSAVCYAWFIWEKGSKSLPIIDWLIDY